MQICKPAHAPETIRLNDKRPPEGGLFMPARRPLTQPADESPYFNSSSIAARSSRSSASVASMRLRENSSTLRPCTISYWPFLQMQG